MEGASRVTDVIPHISNALWRKGSSNGIFFFLLTLKYMVVENLGSTVKSESVEG